MAEIRGRNLSPAPMSKSFTPPASRFQDFVFLEDILVCFALPNLLYCGPLTRKKSDKP